MTRVKTGINELDEMLGGGLLKGDVTLVAGSTGTGKTTLGLQFVYSGATRFNENGLYVTFEQLPEKIYRDALNFGWNIQELEAKQKVKVICTSPDLLLKAGAGSILDEPIKETNAQRVVIDSISHLEAYLPRQDIRKEVYRFTNYLRTKGLTTILTSETHQVLGSSLEVTGVGISFLADCVILLRLVEIQSSMKKALTILKMRGSNHDKRLREIEITSEGIKVASPFEMYEAVLTGSPRRMAEEKFARILMKRRREH